MQCAIELTDRQTGRLADCSTYLSIQAVPNYFLASAFCDPGTTPPPDLGRGNGLTGGDLSIGLFWGALCLISEIWLLFLLFKKFSSLSCRPNWRTIKPNRTGIKWHKTAEVIDNRRCRIFDIKKTTNTISVEKSPYRIQRKKSSRVNEYRLKSIPPIRVGLTNSYNNDNSMGTSKTARKTACSLKGEVE